MIQKASRLRDHLEQTVQKVRQQVSDGAAVANPVSTIKSLPLNATPLAVDAFPHDESDTSPLPSQPRGNDSWLVASPCRSAAPLDASAISGKSLEAVVLAFGSLS
jgi:hypothetical protein